MYNIPAYAIQTKTTEFLSECYSNNWSISHFTRNSQMKKNAKTLTFENKGKCQVVEKRYLRQSTPIHIGKCFISEY